MPGRAGVGEGGLCHGKERYQITEGEDLLLKDEQQHNWLIHGGRGKRGQVTLSLYITLQ